MKKENIVPALQHAAALLTSEKNTPFAQQVSVVLTAAADRIMELEEGENDEE